MPPGDRFVGRRGELEVLLDALGEARAGRGTLVAIAGEPGIGKTRIAVELARAAERGGKVRVFWGRCHEAAGAPAFWPWVQIARSARAAGCAELEVLEALEAQLGGRDDRLEGTPEQARFELFVRVASALGALARQAPLLCILDDLHWADRSSLRLLQFVAHQLGELPILLIATFRELDPATPQDVATLLGELARLGRMVPLRGLDEAEVGELIADRAGVAPHVRLVHAVHGATQGNPFFVDEVVRQLVAERRLTAAGDPSAPEPLPIPLGVRAAIEGRLASLTPAARAILGGAAVAGREVELEILERAVGAPRGEVLAAIESTERSGLLVRVRGTPGRFAFSHALVREALYDDLAEATRRDWHRRLGEAIENRYSRDLDPHLAELAHHFAAIEGGEYARQAAEYGARAGEASLRRLAFEQAELELRRALRALGRFDGDDPELRCRTLLALAEACRGSGDVDAMTESFREGIEAARGLGPEAFADAVLRFTSARVESFFVDELLVGLMEEALEGLPPAPSAVRARLLARLGAALHLRPGSEERRLALAEEATALARSLGDRRTLAWVLMMRIIASLGPDNLHERLALAGEIIQLADQTGYVIATLEAQAWRVHDLLELGDIEAVDLAIQTFTRLAERLKQPVYLWHIAVWRGMRALLDGRLADAERLIDEALAAGQRASQQAALLRYGEQLLMLRYEQGRMRELEGLVMMAAAQAPAVPTWRVVVASMHLQNGRLTEARAALDEIAAHDFLDFPRDANFLFGVVSVAHIVYELGDAARARQVYALLRPYAGRMTATRPAVSFSGGVSHFLARLAAVFGDDAAAHQHFAAALREHRQLGARPWLARTQTEYARFLLDSGEDESVARAAEMIGAAHEVVVGLGLEEIRPRADEVLSLARQRSAAQLRAHAEAARDEPSGADDTGERSRRGAAATRRAAAASGASRGTPPATSAPPANAFVREGDFWCVAFQGNEVRVRDLTGVRQIALLLARPGEEVSVLDLLDASGRRSSSAGDAGGASLRDAGEMLDRRARTAYREEIASLESELEQARSFNDLTRASAIEGEIAAISSELSRALGLGGRPRLVGAPLERARVSVTRTIRDAIRRLGDLDPRLGRFLDESIHTGRFCCYRPPLGSEIDWTVA